MLRTLHDHLDSTLPAPTPDNLRTRLVLASSPRPPGDVALTKPFGRGFRLELVIDQPGRRRFCGEATAATLGLTAPSALALGVRNTIRYVLARHAPRAHELAPGVTIRSVSADDQPFVSTGLGSVPEVFGHPTHGALVAAPRLSALLSYAVVDRRVFGVAATLLELVADMHRDADDPCSPAVFWHHERRLYEVTLGGDGGVRFDRRLADVVGTLGG